MITTITRDSLYRSLRAVAMFASRDETRFHLCAVYFDAADDGLRLVATDGHTLGVVRPEQTAPEGAFRGGVIVATGDVARLVAAVKPFAVERDSPVEVAVSEVGVRCAWAGGTLSVARVDSKFPPWRAIVPDRDGEPAKRWAIAPRYLARVGEAGRVIDGGEVVDFEVSVAGEMDPVRFDLECPAARASFFVMPMRLYAVRKIGAL